jgi:hypothetical protein
MRILEVTIQGDSPVCDSASNGALGSTTHSTEHSIATAIAAAMDASLTDLLEWNIAMFLRRISVAFGFNRVESAD